MIKSTLAWLGCIVVAVAFFFPETRKPMLEYAGLLWELGRDRLEEIEWSLDNFSDPR